MPGPTAPAPATLNQHSRLRASPNRSSARAADPLDQLREDFAGERETADRLDRLVINDHNEHSRRGRSWASNQETQVGKRGFDAVERGRVPLQVLHGKRRAPKSGYDQCEGGQDSFGT